MTDRNGATKSREDLRRLYALDPEKSLLRNLARHLADPIKPQNEKGRYRPHPLLVWLGSLGFVAGGVFTYFTFIRP